MRPIYFVFCLIILSSGLTSGQDSKFIQFSGFVYNERSEPLPYVHIISLGLHRGTISDRNGVFSIISKPSDTLIFSSVGYKRTYFIIPQDPESIHYSADIQMETDTILLDEVRVFPWATYEEFKEAFLSLELPENDYDYAVKNLEIIAAQIDGIEISSPGVAHKQVMERHNMQTYTYGQYPINNLLNPVAWARFFDALKRGKLKIQRPEKKDDKN
ncbi:MAG: carboxypeptidase-like regulatory domain-containing protein [Bacteroidales bacterium]|nr:MAG: carboxypeptidase-like regulatory domain-containing protein [Bacteroidales bacterium]